MGAVQLCSESEHDGESSLQESMHILAMFAALLASPLERLLLVESIVPMPTHNGGSTLPARE